MIITSCHNCLRLTYIHVQRAKFCASCSFTSSRAVCNVEVDCDVRGRDAALDDGEVEETVSFAHRHSLVSETDLQLCMG